jgi:hypothetical protein
MLSATTNAAKSGHMCPKLPKTTKNLLKSAQRQLVSETLKYNQKFQFWWFLKEIFLFVEEALKSLPTVWILNITISHIPFLLSN